MALGRLGRLNEDTRVYRLRRPLMDGRTEILLRPVDLLTPPRKHRHRYCGVLVPAVKLRRNGARQILGGDDPPVRSVVVGIADEVG